MLTVTDEVRRIVAATPFLEEGLARGILNYSAVARDIRPAVEAALMKPVGESALLMALKRLSEKLEKRAGLQEKLLRETGDLTVRSGLIECTYRRSPAVYGQLQKLLKKVQQGGERFLTFSQGVYETTIIASSSLESKVFELFEKEDRVSYTPSLAAVIIKMPPEAVAIPGVHYPILRQLAWQSVNIIQLISTYTELTIVLENSQVDRAFSTLHLYFSR